MKIEFLFLISRQGKVRLVKWYQNISQKEKNKMIKEISSIVLSRRAKMCNFIEYCDLKIIYRRYASLFFIFGVKNDVNELLVLEIIHRFVEFMDEVYGNVCELDIIFDFEKAYYILMEMFLNGWIQTWSKTEILKNIIYLNEMESIEEIENLIL